jgi:N-acetyltransferase
MEYVPSLPEDRALHDKYHKQNTEGYGLGKDFVSKARPRSVYYGAVSGDWVCAVDCYDKPPRKKRAQEVLEIVQRELGAVEIPEDGVWGRREGEGWKYRAYLYVREAKCIGFLLVQRIHEAYLVEQPVLLPDDIAKKINENAEGKTRALTALAALKERREAAADRERLLAKEPLKLSRSTHPASLGISRVWTSAPYRKQSIATKLLDTAMEHQHDVDHCSREKKRALEARFVHGTLDELKHITASTPKGPSICGKEDVAFSQPTEAGTRLARKWFGNLWGWSVYVD